MSLLGVSMDLFLAALMIAALVVGARLNGRLKALKQSHEGFARAIVELNDAAVRAERGLAALREATSETHDSLLSRIETARSLAAKLDGQIHTARGLIEQQALAATRAPADPFELATAPAVGESPQGVRRLAQRFGLIPGGESRQTSVRPDVAPAARPAATLPPKPSRRPLPEEDELFEPTSPAPMSTPAPAPRYSAAAPTALRPAPAPAQHRAPAASQDDWAAELEAELTAALAPRPEPTSGPTPEDFAARIRARKATR